jgi:hypothetical protein
MKNNEKHTNNLYYVFQNIDLLTNQYTTMIGINEIT